jgi:hypothetical protein
MLPKDGYKAAKEYKENLKQYYAILALILAYLPIEIIYTKALKKLDIL